MFARSAILLAMRPKKTPPAAKKKPAPAPEQDSWGGYNLMLWLVFFANSLFLIPFCLDRYLAPRFFFLSLVLLAGMMWIGRDLYRRGNWRLQGFDLLLLAWYGLNLASITWAFSWSEAIFYAQKVLLLLLSYALFRQALLRNEERTLQTLGRATIVLTVVVASILTVQLGQALTVSGLRNDPLYDYATGVFGNKGLATDFLFFLLILNILFADRFRPVKWLLPTLGVLLLLILLLQTRTVYLAVFVAALFYLPLRAWTDHAFRSLFLKKILPVLLMGLVLLLGMLALKGRGGTLAERLNPATYLESASANERRFVWAKTDLLNKDHFWLGVGNGSWKIWLPSKSLQGAFRLQEKNIVFTRAHNDYLEVRAEMGIIGAGLFLALFGAAFCTAGLVLLRRPAEDSVKARQRRLEVLAAAAGLLGYGVIQYFDFPRERIEMQVVLAFFFALLAHHARDIWAKGPGFSLEKYKTSVLVLAAAGLVLNLFIGWAHIRGEVHNARLLEAYVANNYPAVLRESAATRSPFFRYNDVVLPFEWYDGVAYFQMKKYNEALTAMEEAYRLNPWSFQVINNYASTLMMNQQPQKAIELFKKALEINPRYDEGKFNIAYAYFQMGDRQQALEWVNRVDTIPNPTSADELRKNKEILQNRDLYIKNIQQQTPPGPTR